MSAQLFVNGRIFTGRREDDFVSAVRVEDGRITWTGRATDVSDPDAIDLDRQTVLPGFIDVHTHPSLVARTLRAVACTPPQVKSVAQMIDAMRRAPSAGQGDDVWIEGWGYDESKLVEHRTPTAADLDQVSRTQPVHVMRSDCHSGVCNTRALQLAGISRATPDPPGGKLGRYPDGEPNGVLIELSANALVLNAMPARGYDHAVRELAATTQHYNERGIVAVADLKARRLPYDHLAVYRDARSAGMKQLVTLYYDWAELMADPMVDLPDHALRGDVKIGGVKLFMDGSISNRTAWVADAYPGSTDSGMTTVTDDAISRAHAYARRNGIQIAFHAMGDRAIQHVIDVLGDETPWLDGVPSVRIDHATLLTRAQIARINAARMRFGVVTQIIFLFAEYDSYVQNLTPEQLQRAYPVQALYHGLADLALSSDAPATTWADPDNVFTSIKAAVDRRAYNGASIGPEHAITVPQAVLLYSGRAHRLAAFPTVGKIDVGFDASFIVLDRDIFTLPVDEIDQVQVAQTYIGGELVHDRRLGSADPAALLG